MTQTDLAYLAGFIDGEGCIFIQKARNWVFDSGRMQLTLAIAQKDMSLLEELKKMKGGLYASL